MRLLLLVLLSSFARAEFLHVEVFMSDMNCPSCSDSLGKAFEKMRGVQHAEVVMDKGIVSLDLAPNNRIALEQIWDTIKRIGFTPGDTKVTVRGEVKNHVLNKTIQIEGQAQEGENIELKGTIAPPPNPRTPLKLIIP